MYGLVLLVIVALVSLLITRVATVALTVTGMARESARFQARSALSGVGFTTTEAEQVVNHPVRRRIVMALMLIGNVGLATAVAGLLGTFANADPEAGVLRVSLLLALLAMVYAASKSPRVDRRLSRLIARLLTRHTTLHAGDYERLLHLAGEYAVQELAVAPGDWLAGMRLGAARLRDEGILVLGVTRANGSYLGVPGRETQVMPGDVLIVYGRGESIARLSERPPGAAGDDDHASARAEQRVVAVAEKAEDRSAVAEDRSRSEPDDGTGRRYA